MPYAKIRLIGFLWFSLLMVKVNAQTEGDHFYPNLYLDVQGNVIDGFPGIDYSPEKKVTFNANCRQRFTIGHYYNLKNERVDGLILPSIKKSTEFSFRKNEQSPIEIISVDSCLGFVACQDSFAVLNNVPVGIKPQRRYIQVIERYSGITFYQHERLDLAKDQITTFLAKIDQSDSIIRISNSESTKGQTKQISYLEPWVKTLEDSSFANKDLYEILAVETGTEFKPTYLYASLDVGGSSETFYLSSIKYLKYRIMQKAQRPIHFDRYWNELLDTDSIRSYYTASINKISGDTVWLNYYLGRTRLYDAAYNLFYPHKMAGTSTYYYPSGAIRKEVRFKKNEPEHVRLLYPNGQLYRVYHFKSNVQITDSLFTESGKSILDSLGNGTETLIDTLNHREIKRVYKKFKLNSSSYYLPDSSIVYQWLKNHIKFREYQTFNFRLENRSSYPLSAIESQQTGLSLIKCLVNEQGTLTATELLSGICQELDTIAKLTTLSFSKDAIWPILPPQKKQKIYAEVIIPFSYNINSFTLYENRKWDSNFLWMNNAVFQQNNLNLYNIPKPNFPVGFR